MYANVEGEDIGSVSDKIQDMLDNMSFPKGYEVKFEGEVAVIKSSFGDLGMGLGLAVLLAFLIIPFFPLAIDNYSHFSAGDHRCSFAHVGNRYLFKHTIHHGDYYDGGYSSFLR